MSHASSFNDVADAAAYVRQHSACTPRLAIVLGSGLGMFAEALQNAVSLPYGDIPHFPPSTVAGHSGRLWLGTHAGVHCVIMQGRHHYYEGHTLAAAAFGIRVMQALGAKTLVVTNAAGGINATFAPGNLMVISDHLNYMGDNPLRGPNEARFGPRFFDMSQAYAPGLRHMWMQAARHTSTSLREGVYAALSGPAYETPAEIRALQRLGADAVGMSTVGEVLVARHLGMEVAGLSVISNLAAGLSPTTLSHQEVTDVAARVGPTVCNLLSTLVHLFAQTHVAC